MVFDINDFLPPWLKTVESALESEGGRAVIVGGFVRDCVLGYRPMDLDIEVYQVADLKTLAAILSPLGEVRQEGAFFGVISLKVPASDEDQHYIRRAEFALPRLESSTGPGHKDFQVVHKPNLTFTQAARRRDFTVNAMGFDLKSGQLLDPYNGQQDAERRELHAVSEAFMEDPLRVFRALQFAGRYGLDVGKDVLDFSQQMDITQLTKDRVYRELGKLLVSSARPSFGLQWVGPLGIGRYLPELGALADDAAKWEVVLSEVDLLVPSRPSENYQDGAAYAHMIKGLVRWMSPADAETFLGRFMESKQVVADVLV